MLVEEIQINGWNLKIERRWGRRNLVIQIKPHSPIIVKANLTLSKRRILKFLLQKADWIEKHQKKYADFPRSPNLSAEELKNLKKKLLQQAKMILPDRILYISDLMGLRPTAVKFRYMKSRWGSCTHDRKITLNIKLVEAPEWVQDAVIVHELAHLKYLNHSAQFWNLVHQFAPQHKEAKLWLQKNTW
jgi:predicted metal-dependent hydrolase